MAKRKASPRARAKVRTSLCPLFRVLAHNDDVTDADFVVEVLQEVFRKSSDEALEVMWEAHNTGVALVEVAPLEQAEFRVDQAHSLARGRGYPLRFTFEQA